MLKNGYTNGSNFDRSSPLWAVFYSYNVFLQTEKMTHCSDVDQSDKQHQHLFEMITSNDVNFFQDGILNPDERDQVIVLSNCCAK